VLVGFGGIPLGDVLAFLVRKYLQGGVEGVAADQTSDRFVKRGVEAISLAFGTLFVQITLCVTVKDLLTF
jgi:hypothetical protein